MLHIDGEAIEAGVRHHFGRKRAGNPQPAIDDGATIFNDGTNFIFTHSSSFFQILLMDQRNNWTYCLLTGFAAITLLGHERQVFVLK